MLTLHHRQYTDTEVLLSWPTLGTLKNLQVLVTNFIPGLNLLARYEQLEFLHLPDSARVPFMTKAIRWMSVNYRLRGVSFDGSKYGSYVKPIGYTAIEALAQLDLEEGSINPEMIDQFPPWTEESKSNHMRPAALTSLSITGTIRRQQMESIFCLPALLSLHCNIATSYNA